MICPACQGPLDDDAVPPCPWCLDFTRTFAEEFDRVLVLVRQPPERADRDALRQWKVQLDRAVAGNLIPREVAARAKWKAERGYGPIDERWHIWGWMVTRFDNWAAARGLDREARQAR